MISKWTGTEKIGQFLILLWLKSITQIYLQTGCVQEKEILRFYMGNIFDNRQVNNFLINQEAMSTWKN